MTAILSVRDLRVDFPSPAGPVRAVRGMDLDLVAGERVGLVGESGSGKSVLLRAVLGLLPRTATVRGDVRFEGRPLVGASARQLREVRGRGIAMIFQDPHAALNPVRTVASAFHDVLGAGGLAPRRRRARACELLAQVGLGDIDRILASHPGQLSGGQAQRVLIATAIANRPRVILADEPTTSLDVTVQAQVLALLRRVSEEIGAALLLVSHDLAVVGAHTDRTLVSYAGRIVEEGPTGRLFADPLMPYTRALLAAHPSVSRPGPVVAIPGDPPDPARLPPGCTFTPRCELALPGCRQGPEPVLRGEGHRVACPVVRP